MCHMMNSEIGLAGSRPNLHHSGTTSGDSIYGVTKSNLKDVRWMSRSDKDNLLGEAFQ